MKMLNTYPLAKKQKLLRSKIIEWVKWPFIIAPFVLLLVNILTGFKPAWSIVGIWSMWIVWSFLFSPQLVEYNRISNFVKLITNAAILLVLIHFLIVKIEIFLIVGIIGFSGLILLGVLFFSNLNRQRQNLFPLLLFLIVTTILGIIGVIWFWEKPEWPIIVLAATGVSFIITFAIILRKDLLVEFAKRFHVK